MSLPQTYKAIVAEAANSWSLKELPLPKPGPNEVLVKTKACGICFSDLAISGGHMGNVFPRTPGHEVIGEVAAVGDSVDKFKIGDRVGSAWHGGHDGSCRSCQRGMFQTCASKQVTGLHREGGWAEYILVRKEVTIRIPDGMDPAEAAPLLCAGVTCFNSLRKMNIEQGNLVAVVGLGGLGHLGIQYANKMGYTVAAISSGGDKRDFATKLGAHHYIDSSSEDAAAKLQELGGAACILATAPNAKAIEPLIAGLSPRGTLVLLAAVPELKINSHLVLSNALSIRGWPSGAAIDSEEALAFAKTHGVKCMIEKFPLADYASAIENTRSGKVRFRSVLTME